MSKQAALGVPKLNTTPSLSRTLQLSTEKKRHVSFKRELTSCKNQSPTTRQYTGFSYTKEIRNKLITETTKGSRDSLSSTTLIKVAHYIFRQYLNFQSCSKIVSLSFTSTFPHRTTLLPFFFFYLLKLILRSLVLFSESCFALSNACSV